MLKKKLLILLSLILTLLVGCSNLEKKIENFSLSSTQDEVTSQIGPPDERQVEDGFELWIYKKRFKTKRDGRYRHRYHRLFFKEGQLMKKDKIIQVYKDEIEKDYRENFKQQ